MRYVAALLLFIVAITGVVMLVGRAGGGGELAGRTMGSTWSVRLLSDPPADLHAAVQGRLDDLEAQLSTWRSDSLISRFNAHASTEFFDVTPQVLRLVVAAKQISEKTGGAFDITVGPLVELWGFGPAKRRTDVPADTEITEAMKHVGYRLIETRENPPALRKLDPAVRLDVSGIAPGYAVDVIADLLEQRGIADYLVEVGGEMRAKGAGPAGRPWRVGIEAPLSGMRIIHRRVPLISSALATSGDYRSFTQREDGRRVSHFIDPRTGRAMSSKLGSVSVIMDRAADADAMATALYVLGPEAGLRLAAAMQLPALFVLREGEGLEERMTPAFEKLLQTLE